MGFWAALEEVFPTTRGQRCWFHKMGNVLNALPKSQQARAKADMQSICMAATHADAHAAFDLFVSIYAAKYPKATETLNRRSARSCSRVQPQRHSRFAAAAGHVASRSCIPCVWQPAAGSAHRGSAMFVNTRHLVC
jgi:transposase-like protein